MINTKKSIDCQSIILDVIYDLAGCTMLSIGLICFASPNNIAPGGVGGIAVIANYLFGVPISAVTMILNIPLIIMAWFFLGHRFTIKTLKSVMILTILLGLAENLPKYEGNVLLAALYEGVFGGIGIALVFMRSSTTGGTDIVSRLIQLKYPVMPVGKLIMCVDGCVLVIAAFAYGNIENSLLGLIAIFTSTTIIDKLVYGLDTGKLMMIMTTEPRDLMDGISGKLRRSCTLLDGRGSYTEREQPVVMCVVRKTQYLDLKRIVHDIDPAAFMFALDASEIIGEGFKDIAESTKVQ